VGLFFYAQMTPWHLQKQRAQDSHLYQPRQSERGPEIELRSGAIDHQPRAKSEDPEDRCKRSSGSDQANKIQLTRSMLGIGLNRSDEKMHKTAPLSGLIFSSIAEIWRRKHR